MTQTTDTKTALVFAAGELFAEHGFEGATVRAIAERAGANIAAVNYHFGSKEHLYTEVLRHALIEGPGLHASAFLENDERLDSPSGTAAILRELIYDAFWGLLSPQQPKWYAQVIARSLVEPSASLREVAEQLFEPDQQALRCIIRRARPDLTDEQARLWGLSIAGQICFYIFCRQPILLLLGEEEYSEAFLEEVVAHIATLIITALGISE